jgi:2-dehydro-3-deoxyphosphooctonate aldolase (KDO 8-P synthase)
MTLTDLPQITHAYGDQFFLIAGPCAIEGEEMCMRIAEKVKTVTDSLSIPFIFKGSFKKLTAVGWTVLRESETKKP